MITPSFESLYNRLNEAQKKAVDAIEGAVMVVAGPGTGKTEMLSVRIANILLKTQTNPENILAVTFTESAVHEMKKRLVAIIGTLGYRVEVHTFHGICNDVIKRFPDYFNHLLRFEPIDELEQIEIIESILTLGDFSAIRPSGDLSYYVKPALSAINDLKKEGVSPESFSLGLKKEKEEWGKRTDLFHEKGPYKGKMKSEFQMIEKQMQKNSELAEVYDSYQKELKKRKKYDYNDMLLEVVTALTNEPNLLMQLQEQYQYVLVDEHQDTNSAQNKLIELICSYYPNPNLFVVGDEKQAIFRFQGASLENFLYFKHLYPEAVLIHLSENYRSSQKILDAADNIIKYNIRSRALFPQELLKAQKRQDDKKIHIAEIHTFDGEYYWLAKELREKGEKGGYKNCAVIARNNKDLDFLVFVLDQEGIPYALEADQNIFHDLHIQKLMSIFRSLFRFGSEEELIKTMHIDVFGIEPLDMYKICHFAHDKKQFVIEILSQPEVLEGLRLKNQNAVIRFYELMKTWKEQCSNTSFDAVFLAVLNESGMLKLILKKKNSIEILEKVSLLFDMVKKRLSENHLFGIDEFMAYWALLDTHQVPVHVPSNVYFKDAVRLMTAHKSKGQEFDYVFVINGYDGHWGNQRTRAKLFKIPWARLTLRFDTQIPDDQNEDERRLFYVALTRARKEVYISYSLQGIDLREQGPSQFIQEIQPENKTIVETHSFEQLLTDHAELKFKPVLIDRHSTAAEMKAYKDYFWELFQKQGFSVSALNNYLLCPWRFFFRNLIRIPEERSISLIFGSAIHYALNMYLTQSKIRKRDGHFVIESFEQSLSRQPLSEREMRDLKKKGEAILTPYYQNKMKLWGKQVQSELVIPGIRFTEHIYLNGRIDMMEKKDATNDVVIYDFKTGKPKTRQYIEGKTKTNTGDYKRQLIFYKILLDQYLGGKYHMTEGVIEFIEPDAKGIYHSERFTIGSEDEAELKKTIIHVGEEIRNLSFWDRRCDDRDCPYCKIRSFM